MYSSDEKKQKSYGNYLPIVLYMLIGAAVGFYLGKMIGAGIGGDGETGMELLVYGCASVIVLALAIYLHTIVHEAGHLLFGLLTGYGFVSFRVGKFMLMKENGRIKRKKYTVVGTGGQCLMSPPERSGEDYPYALYNIGGVILNILCGCIFFFLYVTSPDTSSQAFFCLINSMIAAGIAIMNGIPMKISGVPNDGLNTLWLGRDKESKNAFWLQLRINALLSSGTRLRDMPKEWFESGKDTNLQNPLICTIGVYRCSYCHDMQDFARAKEESLFLLENAPGLIEVHKNELRCELLFYEIIGECRAEEIERLYTKRLKGYIKATASYIARKRLQYAIEKFVNKNDAEANKQIDAFEELTKTYPYAAEIEAEREIFSLFSSNMY